MKSTVASLLLLLGSCSGQKAAEAPGPGAPGSPAKAMGNGPIPAPGRPPGQPPPGVPAGAELCTAYVGIPNAHDWCIYKNIRSVQAFDRMMKDCAQAAQWADDCRQEWIHVQLEKKADIPRTDLLAACGRNADCALEVLDSRPLLEPLAQFEACRDLAGQYASDCAGHALERWWATRPGREEVARIAQAVTPFPNEVGRMVGASKVCRGNSECEGDPAMVPWCEQWAAKFTADPRGCPP